MLEYWGSKVWGCGWEGDEGREGAGRGGMRGGVEGGRGEGVHGGGNWGGKGDEVGRWCVQKRGQGIKGRIQW